MRRFLDWTTAQTASQSSAGPSNRRSSLQMSHPKNPQQLQPQQQPPQNQQPPQVQHQHQQQAHQLLQTSSHHNPQSYHHHVHHHQPNHSQRHHLQQQHSQPVLPTPHTNPQCPSNPTRELEIQHLIKLLHEIKYYQASSSPLPSAASSQTRKEFTDKIHKTLPLFINVFASNQTISYACSPHSMVSDEASGQSIIERLESSPFSDSTSTSASKPSSPLQQPRIPNMDKFPDIMPFAFTIARLFVSEVRQRASSKRAEDASVSILQYLDFKFANNVNDSQHERKDDSLNDSMGQQDTSHGWNLLLSLNTLASSQSPQIIQLLCDASLPSTLIKCLYLFFDLPLELSKSSTSQGHTTTETSVVYEPLNSPLLKAFTHLLIQLCSYQMAIDELIKKDDLRLLMGIASTQCAPHNRPWRKTAFHTLMTISKNMRDHFDYLEQNFCIRNYIDNMHRINSLGLVNIEEYIEMIRVLLDFLYNLDVNNRNQPHDISPLISQFKSSRIMELIDEALFKIDELLKSIDQSSSPITKSFDANLLNVKTPTHSNSKIDDLRQYGKNLISSMTVLAKINTNPEAMSNITTLKPLAMSRFEMFEQFKMPKPSARNCILNYESLRFFKMAWIKCQDVHIIESILDATISLFNDDKYNYFIFESQQLLVYYITSHNFNSLPIKVKRKLFKFLEFVTIETNYIPCLELGTIGTIIKQKEATDVDLTLGLKTLISCLRFNSKFCDIFREIGLLEVVIELLIKTMDIELVYLSMDKMEVLYLLLDASQHLLAGPNNLNCIQFNEGGAARYVFGCLSKPEFFHLFLPAHGSSSDESTTGQQSKSVTHTGVDQIKQPQSATVLSHNNWAGTSTRYARNKPSIKQLHKMAFAIIRQLILSSAGDEHLANLLGLLTRDFNDLKNCDVREVRDDNVESVTLQQLDINYLMSQEVNLKICILKSLMIILKDSHRCRALFRKTGGFSYIVAALRSVENTMPSHINSGDGEFEKNAQWKRLNYRKIWRLIKNAMMTIIVAMRYEPANSRDFSDDARGKLADALRNLGCFKQSVQKLVADIKKNDDIPINRFDTFKSVFLAPPARDLSTLPCENVQAKEACCQLFRFLYDMSLDMGDGTHELELYLENFTKSTNQPLSECPPPNSSKSFSFDQENLARMNSRESDMFKRRSQLQSAPKRPPSLDLNAKPFCPAILTFPSMIITVLDLIPSCPDEDLKRFICLIVKSLFRHERNIQMLCEAGMITKLLDDSWSISITDKKHSLHRDVEYMLEKLAQHSITARELKIYMRLDNPMHCMDVDNIQVADKKFESDLRKMEDRSYIPSQTIDKIATSRIETLKSMISKDRYDTQPPFVEFNMSSEGCSSIFMPSIAPVNAKMLPPNTSLFLNSTLDVHTSEKNGILGGVGSLERIFPPNNGLTFSSWICIEKFPARSSDSSHNIRLLTIYRGSAATGKEFSCLRVQLSALDRALTISTQELSLFDNENRPETAIDPDSNARIWTPELITENMWHHIAITLTRITLKQGTLDVYLDGLQVHHQKISYIGYQVGLVNTGPLGSNSSINSQSNSGAAFVNAFIGSLPQLRVQNNAIWKQGPCHLIEESLGPQLVGTVFALGPNYVGNFQSSHKLNELARFKEIQADVMKPHQSDSSNVHRQIHHQQSMAAVPTSTKASGPLTRISSTGLATAMSSTQATHHATGNNPNLTEDKILICIDARAVSLMTLSRMRRIYTRFDCRQVSRVLGLTLHENSTPILLLHNTSVHLNGSSRSIGAVTVGYNHVRCFVSSPTQQTLFNIGGCYILLGMVAQAQTNESLEVSVGFLVTALKQNSRLQAQIECINGYQILAVMFWKKKHLLDTKILHHILNLVVEDRPIHQTSYKLDNSTKAIQQIGALRDLICDCFDLWFETEMIDSVLEFIHDLINSNPDYHQHPVPQLPSFNNNIRMRNLKSLREMDLLPRLLRLLPQYDSQIITRNQNKRTNEVKIDDSVESIVQQSSTLDTKAVYLIKHTIFELLDRTPRQSDLLYFAQFLASLLPSNTDKERPKEIIKLRNILLRSLLQMISKNRQKEVNQAVQEELVRIVGFDWFMLFLTGSHLDDETVTLGFLNLMAIVSNRTIFENFKSRTSTNGSWLKEPIFPTMDGKFNIQLLGINVGVFFGMGASRRSIRHEVLEASNLFLLCTCLRRLSRHPKIYLMIFLTVTGRLSRMDSNVMEEIENFDKLNLDSLCDCLVGETHHKRRQTLSKMQFRCHELIICVIAMVRELVCELTTYCGENKDQEIINYPVDLIRFLMYLYNNNPEFQEFCMKSHDFVNALSELLMLHQEDTASFKPSLSSQKVHDRSMIDHNVAKEILELSRMVILDRMTKLCTNGETSDPEQLIVFERFIECLSESKVAQGALVDMLLTQILLMIDSTARNNSSKTLENCKEALQFQALLINSIYVSQMVVDKIWIKELYCDNLTQISKLVDHQLCLTEQIYKFNEILPKNNPAYAFLIQRVLNRVLLFALSRPIQHMSDVMMMLDLLKKIYDNRTIIILNHMHSQQTPEFFVCMIYCLMQIIEQNSEQINSQGGDQPMSLIERQYGSPSIMSHGSLDFGGNEMNTMKLMLVSMAKKVWDAIYQSKKGVLSDAMNVSMSLPAFTLDTSLDLIQLKPEIQDSCERHWSNFVDSEHKPRRRNQAKPNEPLLNTNTTTSAVHMLSGRLTRVVNAASFVSRVVGATAGSMASNVNQIGEKLAQPKATRRGGLSRGVSEASSTSPTTPTQLSSSQQSPSSPTHNEQHLNLFKNSQLSESQVLEAYSSHIQIIEEYIGSHMTQNNHKHAFHKYLCEEWMELEYEHLLRERAIWGPDHGSVLEKWCLDLTEGPRRMRKKMVNNTRQFYENYPYNPEQYNPDNKSLRYRPPMSHDSYHYHNKTLSRPKNLLDDKAPVILSGKDNNVDALLSSTDSKSLITEKRVQTNYTSVAPEKPRSPAINVINSPSPSKSAVDSHSSIESLTSQLLPQAKLSASIGTTSPRPSDGDQDDGDTTSFVDFSPEIEAESNSARDAESIDSLSVLRLLEKSERISHMFRCSRVQGLDTYEGLLLFGREHFYLIDGFTLLKTREIKDIDSLPADAHDPIIPNSTPNILAHSKKTCAKFAFDSVVEVHKRRYLLQPIALEVFSSDGRNTLIVFPRNIRNKVYARLTTVATQLNSNAHESLAGQKSNVSVEGGSGLLSNLIGETSVTQRWVRGELSNFQYLMNLNTIAGRSYNDLMQYPIFPWILADYFSDYLDLTKPSTFRDLSRPVGAQNCERLEQFKRRFAEWDDSETPPYHYGTFYSSAMIVASYMVRMEPFTQHFLRLQGGHFDLADRMFHSIGDSWLSASKHNMADIKELIPEFFYLPEFLNNQNHYDLGVKQNGMRLDDVVLPPWAKNDAREFIRLHRSALESDYVSSHLHEWIDLIFGYKQQGQAAVDAVNVFHHLFYEGNVDIYNTDIDPIKKNAVIGFINNFGQVPKQLFKKPHPVRKVSGLGSSISSQTSLPLNPLLPSLSAGAGLNSGHKVLTHCLQSLKLSNFNFKDLKGPVGQIVQIDKNIVSVEQNKLLIPPEYCRYIAWGHADRSMRLALYDSEKAIFVWEGSDSMAPSEILCCTIPNNRTMISAGTDSMITVWRIEKMKSFTPMFNLYGHVDPITCLASSQAYSIIVSGSRDKTAILWDLNRFTFVRQLGGVGDKIVHAGPISAIAINDSTGDIATCASSWLYLWTINGELLAHVDTFPAILHQSFGLPASSANSMGQLHILSVCFSQFSEWDLDEVIVVGTSDGSVSFWSMRYYQSALTLPETSNDNCTVKTKEGSASDASGDNNVKQQTDSQDLSKEEPDTPKLTGEDTVSNMPMQDDSDILDSGEQNYQGATSDPINIKPSMRRRTDTINSEWVRLSASSTSTTETIPVFQATPSSSQDNAPIAGDGPESMSSSDNLNVIDDNTSSMGPDNQVAPSGHQAHIRSLTPVGIHSTSLQQQTGAPSPPIDLSAKVANMSIDECDGQSMSKTNLLLMASEPSMINFSKSDNSLIESFVLLDETSHPTSSQIGATTQARPSSATQTSQRKRPQSSSGGTTAAQPTSSTGGSKSPDARRRLAGRQGPRSACKLLPNHVWKRELFLRGTLPRRSSKTAPPFAVTSLAISKDCRTLYVGDAGGRVTSWSTV